MRLYHPMDRGPGGSGTSLHTGFQLARAVSMHPPSYVWNSPSRKLSVHLPLDLVESLGLAAMEAFKSVPRRGLEIGGVLLGRSEQRDGVTLIYLEGFTPVESEHRSGPSYLLSDRDMERLDKAARRSDAIGMYRTQTRSESLSLQADDAAIFQRYFDAPNQVFLLIQPASRNAALFVSKNGALALAHELPFHAAELPATTPEERSPSPDAAEPPVASPLEPRSVPGFRSARLIARRWLVPVAAGALGLAIGATTIHYRSQPPKPPANSVARVGMNVERVGKGLKLQWDRDSALVRAASHGSLHIIDGTHQSTMNLAPRELTTGAVSYWPESQDVTFRLDLFSPDRNTTDSIRFMAAGPPPPDAPATAPVQVAAAANSSTPRDTTPITAKPAANPPQQKARKIAAGKSSEGSASRVEMGELKPSPLANTPEPAASEPAVAEPEPATSAPVAAADPAPSVSKEPARAMSPSASTTPPPVRTATRVAGVTVTAEPVQGSGLGRAFSKIPLLGRLKKKPQPFVPPKALKEIRPSLTPRDRNALTRAVPVDVRVYVTENGKVDYAELMKGASHRDLAAAAVYAARRWAFAPARLGEEKVPGEVILHFVFEP